MIFNEDTMELIKSFEYLIKKRYEQLEIEIEMYADNAKPLKRPMDVGQLYKSIVHTSYSKTGEKLIIDEEWRILVRKIEDAFTTNSKFVKCFGTFKEGKCTHCQDIN